ncbi:MAG: hypothetical protein IKP78_08095 [Ruminococcus sp.]|nr:hypothetical protein [Ruminococcus sp.]
MKHLFAKTLAAGAVVCALMSAPIYADAATPEEAAELARQYGYSEDLIQQGWNEYYANPELYPPEVIDMYMEQLRESGHKIVTEVPYDPNATVPAAATQTSPAATTTTAAGSTQTTPAQPDVITLTMPDGSTFTRITAEAFIALSYEDKQAYLATFTPEQQKIIIENLSPEEYRSLMKQLPADKKMEVIDDMKKITDNMNLTLTVDEVSDDNVKISMKNSAGELVAVSQAKDTVENTGYDRRGIFAAAGALLLTAFAGMYLVVRKCFGREDSSI